MGWADRLTDRIEAALGHPGNCSLRCSRPLFQTRLYLLHPWSRTSRHPWRSLGLRAVQGRTNAARAHGCV
jgi:hypothetical protein